MGVSCYQPSRSWVTHDASAPSARSKLGRAASGIGARAGSTSGMFFGSALKIQCADLFDQNRLLEMIRHQQSQLQQLQQQAGYTPSTSTAAVDDSTPTSERSFSFPNVPGSAPLSASNPPRSPVPRSSIELSRQSSRRSRAPSRTASPALLPQSAGLQPQGEEWLLLGGPQSSRDDSAYYSAETQALTRENQLLRTRIRQLGMAKKNPRCNFMLIKTRATNKRVQPFLCKHSSDSSHSLKSDSPTQRNRYCTAEARYDPGG